MQPTVLLVTSRNLNWAGLRATLIDRTDAESAEVGDAPDATRYASGLRPDVIFVAAEIAGLSLVALVRALREVSPASKIIIVGEKRALRREALWALGELHNEGYQVWEDLDEETLPLCLATVLRTNLRVFSPAVVDAGMAPADRRQRPRTNGLVLKDDERAALRRLAAGLTQQEIMAEEGWSEPKAKRAFAALRERFDATTMFELGMKAALQGFVP